MSLTTRSDALEQSCTNCGAEPGRKCVGARGKQRESVHRERLNAAAVAQGHAATRTLEIERAALLDADGNIVGQVSGVFDVQSEELWGNLRRGDEESKAVDVPSESLEEQPNGGVGVPETGQLFDSDPVAEVFEHYRTTVPGKERNRLTREVRKLIAKALDERPIDQLKLAITGLSLSQFHLDGGYTALAYAIGKTKQSETVGDRIDTMAAKAPKQSASGEITVEDSLRTVPSDRHWIIRETMSLVIQAIKRGERAEREEEMLLRSPGVKPIINNGQFSGWERVS